MSDQRTQLQENIIGADSLPSLERQTVTTLSASQRPLSGRSVVATTLMCRMLSGDKLKKVANRRGLDLIGRPRCCRYEYLLQTQTSRLARAQYSVTCSKDHENPSDSYPLALQWSTSRSNERPTFGLLACATCAGVASFDV
jgi:hypothetical protein